jgi:hypothetical protein
VGLGLSIVSKIMDEHHGSIELATGATGARFVLFFPFSESRPAGSGQPAEPEAEVAPGSQGTRNSSEALPNR